ncbi:DUF6894 family protein [Brevundimonas sp.]|uniref:DUF6894 family protein n=1 Tax=Brevundimonas sp. TaxID=1871086 RepID=UPI002D394E16|nr:hypothetical protein [Brevundimonas sp.]HYC68821.1 hypothetical protein [Brevundimonas sp.]
MPRYFFDTSDDEVWSRDTQGLECADPQAARHEAIKSLPYIALDALPDGPQRQFAVEVRDEGGRRLFSAELLFRSEWLAEA